MSLLNFSSNQDQLTWTTTSQWPTYIASRARIRTPDSADNRQMLTGSCVTTLSADMATSYRFSSRTTNTKKQKKKKILIINTYKSTKIRIKNKNKVLTTFLVVPFELSDDH